MLFLFASHLALAHIQDDAIPPRAYILGGGSELPPLLRKMSEVVSKIDKSPGWKNLPDGKIAFRSAKQICFIFLPSLREIQNWQNIVFFRKKIERDGFWAKFQFGELHDHLKEKLRATLPELEFKVNSAISIGPQIITSITGLGRKVNVPANLIQPDLKGLGLSRKAEDDKKARAVPRFINGNTADLRPLETYLDGFYLKRPKNSLILPESDHIALSACDRHECAYEVDGRGVFSKNLIEVLEAAPRLTYVELFQRVRMLIGRGGTEQTPQFEANGAFDAFRRFLASEVPRRRSFPVYFK